MAKNNGAAVLFDLDGVVIDSIWSIWMATRDLLEEAGVPFARLPDFRSFLSSFSMPGHHYYRNYGVMASFEELARRFLQIIPLYEAIVEPYSGMPQTIETLRSRGVRTAIVSAGNPERVEQKLARFGLRGLFDAVYADPAGKTASIKDCCAQFNCAPQRTFFVGDLQSDMRDGRAAGVISLGFVADYPFMVPVLTRAGAAVCFREPAELLKLVF
ncbi:MAG: HAD hydrolase-like protein [Candidatus Vogelbacteria bacterium]|nr:HAD hydrolase-like protein [Candidatus Vogelbacteria bacterium]